jgi:hypothetical protein
MLAAAAEPISEKDGRSIRSGLLPREQGICYNQAVLAHESLSGIAPSTTAYGPQHSTNH